MFAKEKCGQQRDVLFPFPKGWKLYGEDIQPIEQVQTEFTQSYFFFQVPVRSRHDPDIDGDRFLASDAGNLTFF